MNDLVTKLANGRHPVEVVVRPETTLDGFREAIELSYVHVRFKDTEGGTELGLRIEPDRSRLPEADLEAGEGEVTLAGELTLDFVPVTCFAVVQLPELTGEGWLELRDPPSAS